MLKKKKSTLAAKQQHTPVWAVKWNGVDYNRLFLHKHFYFFENQAAAGVWFSISQNIQGLDTLKARSSLKSKSKRPSPKYQCIQLATGAPVSKAETTWEKEKNREKLISCHVWSLLLCLSNLMAEEELGGWCFLALLLTGPSCYMGGLYNSQAMAKLITRSKNKNTQKVCASKCATCNWTITGRSESIIIQPSWFSFFFKKKHYRSKWFEQRIETAKVMGPPRADHDGCV